MLCELSVDACLSPSALMYAFNVYNLFNTIFLRLFFINLRSEHTRRQVPATRCGDTSLRQIALSVLENFCENLCLRNIILSRQRVAKNQIRLNLCDLLRGQNSVAETKICTWIHQTEYAPSDLSLRRVAQLIARPVHTEWFIAAKCCSDMSPRVYVFTLHRTNFRPAEIFDQTLRSHGTVQDFGFV